MRLQVPWNYGIFGTIWTIVIHNPSFSNWHFDPGDFGLAALLYFGKFTKEKQKDLKLNVPGFAHQ
jgi:hypothetical protein